MIRDNNWSWVDSMWMTWFCRLLAIAVMVTAGLSADSIIPVLLGQPS